MRVAAIDVGTNTVLCTIAELDPSGVHVIDERAHITRLGAGVDRTRNLSPEASARTLECLGELASLGRALGVSEILAAGTSALRDAGGAAEFVAEATRILDAPLVVLDGVEEARLTFAGATWDLELDGAVCVVDIGGGSTEIVEGRVQGESRSIDRAVSLDIGSVRLFERLVQHDPPAPDELRKVQAAISRVLYALPRPAPATLVAVAGTVTTLVALNGQAVLHGARLTHQVVLDQARSLARLPLAKRLELPGLEPGRADVIPVGALLLSEIMRWLGAEELTASDRGVRWGLLRDRVLRFHRSEPM